MLRKKVYWICVSIQLIVLLGFLISYFLFPEYIGDHETDLFDIVPKKVILLFSIPICMLIVLLQIKYKIIVKKYVADLLPVKMLVSLILYPFLSVMISALILFNLYSYSNYCFISDKEKLSGCVYKLDIYKVSRGADKYYVYFNDLSKYKIRVAKEAYGSYKIGDTINLNVLKGRFHGYYLISKD